MPVIDDGDDWFANVVHPADASFVLLRAEASDTDGNTVEQVEQPVLRAYGLR